MATVVFGGVCWFEEKRQGGGRRRGTAAQGGRWSEARVFRRISIRSGLGRG
jgi:hypothetical protein